MFLDLVIGNQGQTPGSQWIIQQLIYWVRELMKLKKWMNSTATRIEKHLSSETRSLSNPRKRTVEFGQPISLRKASQLAKKETGKVVQFILKLKCQM